MLNPNDIMIDLETLDVTEDAYILSIGACTMDKSEQFYEIVGTKQNRSISVDTIWWWTQQSPQARDVIGQSKISKTSLPVALCKLTEWLGKQDFNSNLGVWSHGATFDIKMLENAYHQFNLECPWAFWQARDTRTLINIHTMLTNNPYKLERSGIHHNALDDALYQAAWMTELVRQLEPS